MLMSEIRRVDYQIFDACENGIQRTKLLAAITYIDQLGTQTSTDVSAWEVLNIFKNPRSEKGFIHTDKNKINEIFFQELVRIKGAPYVPKLKPYMRDELRTGFESFLRSERDKIKRNHMEYSNRAHSAYTSYTSVMIELTKFEQQLALPIKSPDNLIAQVNQIINDEFWELTDDIGDKYLKFYTKPIVLKYVNPAQAADITVPMGRFVLQIELNELSVQASPLHSTEHPNVVKLKHYHPHLDTSHRFCFGNMLTDYNLLAAEGNYAGVMEICKAILTGYWPDNPFVHLHQFRDEFQARAMNEKHAKERQAKQKEEAEKSAAAMEILLARDIAEHIERAAPPIPAPTVQQTLATESIPF